MRLRICVFCGLLGLFLLLLAVGGCKPRGGGCWPGACGPRGCTPNASYEAHAAASVVLAELRVYRLSVADAEQAKEIDNRIEIQRRKVDQLWQRAKQIERESAAAGE